MGYRSSVTCIMYAIHLPLSDKTDTEAGQVIVNEWLKQRIPDFKEMNGLDLHSYFEFEKDKAVFKVEDWKWYPDYAEVKALEDLFKEFADTFCPKEMEGEQCGYAIEFIRFGEDWADVEGWGRNSQYRLDFHRTIYID
jgi:hypothetical protein